LSQGRLGLSNLLLASFGLNRRGTERNSLPKGVRHPGVAAVSRRKVVPVELFFLLSTHTHHSAAHNGRAQVVLKTDSSHLLHKTRKSFSYPLHNFNLLTSPLRTTTTSKQVIKTKSVSGPRSSPSSATCPL